GGRVRRFGAPSRALWSISMKGGCGSPARRSGPKRKGAAAPDRRGFAGFPGSASLGKALPAPYFNDTALLSGLINRGKGEGATLSRALICGLRPRKGPG